MNTRSVVIPIAALAMALGSFSNAAAQNAERRNRGNQRQERSDGDSSARPRSEQGDRGRSSAARGDRSAEQSQRAIICGLARSLKGDIDRAAEAVKPAGKRGRVHVFLATSAIHRQFKLGKAKEEIIKQARDAMRDLSKSLRKRLEGVASLDGEEIRKQLREEVVFECQEELRALRKELMERSEQDLVQEGKRILVGPKGGGTNNLAVRLLAASKVTAENSTFIDDQALPDYVDALASGRADAGFLVLAPDARTVQRLLAQPDTRLMSFAQGEGLTRLFPFLSRVTLPQGVVDLENNNPPEDTQMVSTTAALVVRDDLHPALVNLLTQAVIEVHGGTVQGAMAMFQKVGEFPRIPDPEFPVAAEAARVYKSGPPFLQRYLPFWLATMIERLVLMLIPALTVVLPMMKLIPAVYRWRIRRRILYWYGELKRLERSIYALPGREHLATHFGEIERIDEAVANIRVPLAFSDQLYNMRSHLDIVRQRLTQRAKAAGATA